ncbi:MAG: hypothetical protein ACXVHO_04515 [Methanobacterium sp.]
MQQAQLNGLQNNMFVGVVVDRDVGQCLQDLGYVSQRVETQNQVGSSQQDVTTQLACQVDTDCSNGFSCRSKKNGGTECRKQEPIKE